MRNPSASDRSCLRERNRPCTIARMLMLLLSPAKTLDFETPVPALDLPPTRPQFQPQAVELMALLRAQSPAQLATLMGLSDSLATTNTARHAQWSARASAKKTRPSAYAFDGPVYRALDARSLTPQALAWAQQHITILSGLYGALRPLDPIQPHRLEMGTRLGNAAGATLYDFWGARVAQWLDRCCKAHDAPLLVNLASAEYARVVDRQTLRAPLLDCVFEQSQGGRHRVVGVHAKRARGLMARWVVQQRATRAAQLQAFDAEGYAFVSAASDEQRLVFRRAA